MFALILLLAISGVSHPLSVRLGRSIYDPTEVHVTIKTTLHPDHTFVGLAYDGGAAGSSGYSQINDLGSSYCLDQRTIKNLRCEAESCVYTVVVAQFHRDGKFCSRDLVEFVVGRISVD